MFAKKNCCKRNYVSWCLVRSMLHSSCSLILSLQALVPLIRFTAALMGPVFTITVPGSLLRDAIKNVFSRVFSKDFISGMCKQDRCDATLCCYFFLLRFPWWQIPQFVCLHLQTIDTVQAGAVMVCCRIRVCFLQLKYFWYKPCWNLRSFCIKTAWVFNSWLNRSKTEKLLKEKRLQTRKTGANGAPGDYITNRISKFITYLWGREHSNCPLCTTTTDGSACWKTERGRHDPTCLSELGAGKKKKHIYSDTFHTLSHSVKGLGSAGEPANWIRALVAIARFCNLKASRKKKKKKNKKENRARHPWLRCYQGVLWYVTWLSMIKQSWSALLYLSMICQGYYSPSYSYYQQSM